MAQTNAKFERARARARLAMIAPAVDEVSAVYFERLVEIMLLEAEQRGMRDDHQLLLNAFDAIARKYYGQSVPETNPSRVA